MKVSMKTAEQLKALGYENIKVLTTDDLKHTSEAFGTPVFMPLTFEEIRYTDEQTGMKIVIPELFIPCAIVEVNFSKTIVKTTVQNQRRQGTFKEFIALDDYEVRIRGLLSDDNGKYPLSKTKWLHDIGTQTQSNDSGSVGVIHQLLNTLGITDLVIESGGLIPKQGCEDLQPFELNCVSDREVRLILKSEENTQIFK